MIHDIEKLHAVSIWMTRNLVSYTFLVEFREINKVMKMREFKIVNDFVIGVIDQAELLLGEDTWKAYVIQLAYDKQFIFQSNHNNFLGRPMQIEDPSPEGVADPINLLANLTKRERRIFCLLAQGLNQKQICMEL
jgi:ATP/maltotriose-dependent transcriptional regulator MalT